MRRGSSAGPFIAAVAATSNLSIGSGFIVSFSWWAHLTTSALFRTRARGPVSGQLCATISWKGPTVLPRFPVAFRLPALASWSSCSRRGVGLSLRSAYRLARGRAGPRRGFRVSHARAAIGVGALSTPGTTVLILTAVALRPASVASQRRVPKPRHNHHPCGALLDEASPRVHTNSPVRSSLRLWLPDETGALGLYRRASHPALTSHARRGGDRSSSTDLNQRSTSSSTEASNHALISQCVRPRVARDEGAVMGSNGRPHPRRSCLSGWCTLGSVDREHEHDHGSGYPGPVELEP